MVDVLDPSGLTGFRQGPFRYSAEDSRFYLLTPDGAIPADGAPRGLLVEPSGTNLLTQSEFVNGVTDAPSRAGLISATSFSGLISGTGLAFGYDGSTETRAYKSFSRAIGETYTFSVFVRMDDGLPPVFGHAAVANPANDFNIVTSGASGDAPPAYRIENYGSGLYRVSRVITQNTAGGNVGIIKYPTNSARTFKVSGYQLSSGASPTSYIPTGASAVTRAADSAVMSGTDFSDWFNPAEGTFVAEADHANPLGTSTCALAIDDGGNTNRFLLSAGSDGGLQAWAGANATASLGIITANTTFRAALTYSSAGVAGCMNGGAVQSAAMPALTGLNALRLGHRSSSGIGRWNGHFRCVRYIPRRVSNSELQGLTA